MHQGPFPGRFATPKHAFEGGIFRQPPSMVIIPVRSSILSPFCNSSVVSKPKTSGERENGNDGHANRKIVYSMSWTLPRDSATFAAIVAMPTKAIVFFELRTSLFKSASWAESMRRRSNSSSNSSGKLRKTREKFLS